MKLARIFLSLVFVLSASIALAAKPAKVLVCHVGNEVGPGGEDYLDDPGCVPVEENGYFCPDAGKIDLISVAKVRGHLQNPSHTYDGISDYLPEDVGASGVGNEDSNGDGIDDGCQPPAPPGACPCWTSADLALLSQKLNEQGPGSNPQCWGTPPDNAIKDEWNVPAEPFKTIQLIYNSLPSLDACYFVNWSYDAGGVSQNLSTWITPLTQDEEDACAADVVKLQNDTGLCAN